MGDFHPLFLCVWVDSRLPCGCKKSLHNRRDLREMIFRLFLNYLKHRDEILNSYLRPYDDRKLSNSFTENVNGKLRTYLAVSRGISNFQRFRKRVIYSLSKDVQYSLNNSLHSDSVPKRKRGTYKKIREWQS